MREHLWGTRKGPAMVGRDQLPALVLQLRLDGYHDRKNVATTIAKGKKFWRVSQSPRGDWMVKACFQGVVSSDSPVEWTCASNGMAWKHAAAGWWRTEVEATAALEAAFKSAYDDEFAALAEAEATRQAGLAALAHFTDRLQALKARAILVGWSHFSWDAWGWSTGGPRRPYTEEACVVFEAEVATVEKSNEERAIFVDGAPPLFARLVRLGVKTELSYDGNVRIVVDGRWTTPFAMTINGLKELEAYVVAQEKRHTIPVEAKKLDLSGLFGGAVKVTKK